MSNISATEWPDNNTIAPHPVLESLPWPWRAIGQSLLDYAAARQRLLAAQTAGNRDAARRAELDLADAVADHHKTREQLAALHLMTLRCALDLNPVALGELQDAFPVPPAVAAVVDELQDEVLDLRERMARVERLLESSMAARSGVAA